MAKAGKIYPLVFMSSRSLEKTPEGLSPYSLDMFFDAFPEP